MIKTQKSIIAKLMLLTLMSIGIFSIGTTAKSISYCLPSNCPICPIGYSCGEKNVENPNCDCLCTCPNPDGSCSGSELCNP